MYWMYWTCNVFCSITKLIKKFFRKIIFHILEHITLLVCKKIIIVHFLYLKRVLLQENNLCNKKCRKYS